MRPLFVFALLVLAGCGGPSAPPPATVSQKASVTPVAPDPPPPIQGQFTITAHVAYLESSDPSDHYMEVNTDQSVYLFVSSGGENYIFNGIYDGQLVNGTWCTQDLSGITQMGAFSANVSLDANNMPVIDARQLGQGFIWQQMAVDPTGWVGTRPSCT